MWAIVFRAQNTRPHCLRGLPASTAQKTSVPMFPRIPGGLCPVVCVTPCSVQSYQQNESYTFNCICIRPFISKSRLKRKREGAHHKQHHCVTAHRIDRPRYSLIPIAAIPPQDTAHTPAVVQRERFINVTMTSKLAFSF